MHLNRKKDLDGSEENVNTKHIHISEAVVWRAAAVFMPLSFTVNGSEVNLETQCLPGKMCQQDSLANFEFLQTLSPKKTNCQHKQLL